MPKNNTPLEEQEQITFVEWLDLKKIPYCAFPNNIWSPSWGQKMMQKRLGLKKGFPDILVVVRHRYLVFIEMKRIKGGSVSPEQKEWKDILNEIPNVQSYIAKGAEEAIEIIERIVNL